MRSHLVVTASALAIILSASPATAQDPSVDGEAEPIEEISPAANNRENVIIVTATRREQDLQDVPLSVSAFQQEELTEKGIVGYERLARETPGVVLNRPTQNFNNFAARGISINGYSAGLQAPVAIYIDELPISANGNSTILDPNLYDVQRVEFLRGPQGTLFGSGSLAGAMRIITNAPDPGQFEASALVDLGYTENGGIRQRYNGMVNVPIKEDEAAFRANGDDDGVLDRLGFHQAEDLGAEVLSPIGPADAAAGHLAAAQVDALHARGVDEDLVHGPGFGQPRYFLWVELDR